VKILVSNNYLEERICNLCKSDDAKKVYKSTITNRYDDHISFTCTNNRHSEHFQVVKCKKCGLYYCSPRLGMNNLARIYSNVQDTIYKEELNGRIKTFKRNLKNLSKHKSNGTLLDIGCSIGVFLSIAKKDGWEVSGIEPSSWCAEQGKKIFNLKDNLFVKDIKDLDKLNKKYDVITMWDVLEHLDDPMQALIICKETLKEGGILAMSTVNIGSLYAKILGKRWPWLMTMHIYYFDKSTIRKYLDKVGLDLLEIRTYKHTISLNYLLYKLKSINIILYTIGKFIKKFLLFDKNIYLDVAFGDFMEIYAQKRNL